MASPPRMVVANGVELCIQTFGDPASPPILLIAGLASSMDWWHDEFCERLASGPRFVIRYDHRDTGQSVSYEPGAPEYGWPDLIADAVGLLDALRVSRAHVVGISMGGAIAQHLAVDRADRVASLTLIATSPGGRDLPPTSERLAAHFAEPLPEPDWSNRRAVVDHIVDDLRVYAGTIEFAEEDLRALVGRIVDRTVSIESSQQNHTLLEGGEPVRPRLGEITAPTLVLHGTEDPLFPYGHGEALAAEIPGARLLPLEGVGHELPPRTVWNQVIGAILEHTAVLVGKCGCGTVRFRVADAFLYASNCHCSRCRAATGSAFKPFAGIEREKLEITDGLDELLVFGDEELNDTRCGVCGSLLFSVVRDGAYVHVALGSLVDPPSLRPTKHIFVGSKAAWFEITDYLPQFEEHARR